MSAEEQDSLIRWRIASKSALRRRRRRARLFQWICEGVAWAGFGALLIALPILWVFAWPGLSWDFLWRLPTGEQPAGGLGPALLGSCFMLALAGLVATPIAVASAILLEEYAPRRGLALVLAWNAEALAALPPVIYGVAGLVLLSRGLALGDTLICGALVLAAVCIPLILRSSREALRAIPREIRLAGVSLSATRWQILWSQVLPLAAPAILRGVVLALSRALGEAAPLVILGAVSAQTFYPTQGRDPLVSLPTQIFNWAQDPRPESRALAASASLFLLLIIGLLNFAVVWFERERERSSL